MPSDEPRRTYRFPSAFTGLAGVFKPLWLLSFVVPAGRYEADKSAAPIPGSYKDLPSCSAPSATAPFLDAESPVEIGQAPADALTPPGATVSDLGTPCVDESLSFRADALLIVIPVDAVYRDWGTPRQRATRRASPAALAATDFVAGSMGPKVRAACRFVQQTGHLATIGPILDTAAMVRGVAGTTVTGCVGT